MEDNTKFVSSLKLEIEEDNLQTLTDEDLQELKRKIKEEMDERRRRGI
jgi:hypothetical protein